MHPLHTAIFRMLFTAWKDQTAAQHMTEISTQQLISLV